MDVSAFRGLVEEPAMLAKVVLGIERAVALSFAQQREPGRIILVNGAVDAPPSQAEMKRRCEICVKMFRELRGDLKWTVERIVDQMPRFLRMQIDGVSWEPEARRATWGAGAKALAAGTK